MSEPTQLFIVPTPIGNLEDITIRAINVLKAADLILAEDTRTSGVLLKKYEIKTKVRSYHMHNEHRIVEQIVDQIGDGQTVAMISDAGTPGISDPGFLLVRACIDNNIKVECLPGATAFVPALVKSGLPCDRFLFEGFLPHKKGRKTRLEQLCVEKRTIVFYESPHRIAKTVDQLASYFGDDRRASLSREISKLYEETINGSLSELKQELAMRKLKGEMVLVVAGKD